MSTKDGVLENGVIATLGAGVKRHVSYAAQESHGDEKSPSIKKFAQTNY